MEKDEWESQKRKTPIGDTVVGIVVHQARFGVFVDLDSGTPGLVELPELVGGKALRPEDYPQVGEKIEAKVLGYSDRNQQVVLSPSSSARSQF